MTKILVIDSERDVCDFTVRFFAERNFEVFSATNGGEALEIIKKDSPHIVLLELEMKDLDGLEVLRHIRKIRQNTKIIIISSVDDIAIMNEARRLGVVAYLTKPVLLSELMDIVSKNLGSGRKFFELKRVSKDA